MAREIIPHEARLRARLARDRVAAQDVDELIQEAYCRLALLDGFDHIDCPYAYFFSIVRNLLIRRLRRQQVVPLEALAEIEAIRDEGPSPEREAAGRIEYGRVLALIARLPERCRRVVELRKIEGWSQRRIAEHLGMTEKAVEKQVWLGVKSIREALAGADARIEAQFARSEVRK